MRKTAAILLMSICLIACGQNLSRVMFTNLESKSSLSSSKKWGAALIIDNGNSVDIVNYDQGDGCSGASPTLLASGGCATQPALVYTEGGQWLVGFPQENPANFDFFTTIRSLITKLFSTPSVTGSALGSNRYMKIKKLTNGNLIAVFWVRTAATRREVYANIYNATTGTWGSAARMSTAPGAILTDTSSDGLAAGANKAVLCRPDVATAGDGSALVTWCEDAAGTGTASVVKYRRYAGGAFIPAVGSDPADITAAAMSAGTKMFGGFKAGTYRFVSIDTNNPSDGATNVNTDGPPLIEIFNTNDYYSFHFMVGDDSYKVTVKGTESSSPSNAEFKVARDGSGTLLRCSTLSNLANALLSQKISTGDVLSDLGFSFVVDPVCVEGSSGTYNMTVYYNKSGNISLRDTGVATFSISNTDNFYDSTAAGVFNVRMQIALAESVQSGISIVRVGTYECGATCTNNSDGTFSCTRGCAIGNNSNPFDFTTASAAYSFNKAAGVSVAGDGYGNYTMVRTAIAPVFTSSTDITSTGIGYARSLVGHEYAVGSGFKSFASGNLYTKKISLTPACTNSTASSVTTACSVKNPKIVMSDNGKGLVFFYQNQPTYSGATLTNPNRIWYAAYGTAAGFGIANILDENTFCSVNSMANDVPVCETGSFVATKECQTLQESLNMTTLPGLGQEYPTSGNAIDVDIPSIQTDINKTGTAIVGYHKKYNSGTLTSPVCTYTGVFVRVYNPLTGFSSQIQLDSKAGNTMHVSVSVNESGNAVAVWEEVRGSTVYLYFSKFNGSAWSVAESIVQSTSGATAEMFPGVKINDSGEVTVSFSHGVGGGPRGQYVKHYE